MPLNCVWNEAYWEIKVLNLLRYATVQLLNLTWQVCFFDNPIFLNILRNHFVDGIDIVYGLGMFI